MAVVSDGSDEDNMSSLYRFILGVLSVWRITHLLNAEDGPWDVLVSFRKLLASGIGGELLDCVQCLSLWIALPFALMLGDHWPEKLLLWPALSAGGILLERLSLPNTPDYFESPGPIAKEKEAPL